MPSSNTLPLASDRGVRYVTWAGRVPRAEGGLRAVCIRYNRAEHLIVDTDNDEYNQQEDTGSHLTVDIFNVQSRMP